MQSSGLPKYVCKRLDPPSIRRHGFNLGKSIPIKRLVVVGQKTKVSNNHLQEEFIKGLNIAGISVVTLGLCTVQGLIYSGTTMQAHCCVFFDCQEALDELGISVLLTYKALSLEELKRLLNLNQPFDDVKKKHQGIVIPINYSSGYLTFISYFLKQHWNPNIVWDISKLPISDYFNTIIKNFQGVHKYAIGIKDVTSAVINNKANFGLIFDKEGKSFTVIDNLGRIVPFHIISSILINNLASFSKDNPKMGRKGGVVLTDIRMPNYVFDLVSSKNYIPRIAHSNELQFNLAFLKYHIEFAAHHNHGFLFRSLGYVAYDALYSAMRLVNAIVELNEPLSTWIDKNVPNFRSKIIKLTVSDKSVIKNKNNPYTKLFNRLESSLKAKRIQYIKVDGFKVSLESGEWILHSDQNNNLQIVIYGKYSHDLRNLILNVKQCFKDANIFLSLPEYS